MSLYFKITQALLKVGNGCACAWELRQVRHSKFAVYKGPCSRRDSHIAKRRKSTKKFLKNEDFFSASIIFCLLHKIQWSKATEYCHSRGERWRLKQTGEMWVFMPYNIDQIRGVGRGTRPPAHATYSMNLSHICLFSHIERKTSLSFSVNLFSIVK